MEKTWQALKPRLVAALVDAFTEAEFAQIIDFRCNRKLSVLAARDIPFPQKVYEVTGHAARYGWLDCLAEGAQKTNETHAELQRVTADVLAGIEAQEGTDFYKKELVDQEAGIEEETVLMRQLQTYLETLQRRTRAVPLAGLDESGEKGGELALERVFIGLDAGQRQVDLEEEGDGKGVSTAAIGYLHVQRQLVLLGDPGSGKSTLLRYVAYCLAGAACFPEDGSWRERLAWPVYDDEGEIVEMRQWTEEAPVPIFVVLRDFARRDFDPNDGTSIIDFVCEKLQEEDLGDAADPLRKLARRGRVLFLLDGVDEVPADERAAVWEAIKALDKGAYGGNRWAATCRVLSFDRGEAPSGVPVERLQPLNEAQIVEFIDNWYGGLIEGGQLDRGQALDKAEALKGAVQRPALRELAQNPMLLTIMALVQTFRGTLPDERAKLYQACVETLLLRWQLRLETGEGDMPDALRQLGTTVEDLQRLLWEIAWEAHSKAEDRSQSADIPRWDVIEIAEAHLSSLGKAEQFLEYTEQRAHLLVGRGGRRESVYSFPHRTFQEYLAACHLAALRRFERRAAELAAQSDDWREVLNLAVGTLAFNQNNREKAFDAVEAMLPDQAPTDGEASEWRQVWLAGEMCATIGRQAAERDEVGREVLPALRELLVALLENEELTPPQRAEAGDALGRLGDPRPGVCTLEPELIEIPAGDFLYDEEKELRSIEKPYAVARYPVTVAQFAIFIEDGGYEEARYWGGKKSAGWRWRLKDHDVELRGEGPVMQPEFWQQPRWHGENRPVVGVSWYEAQAYCAWLTEKSEREYRLPSEEEWERAARHTDGRNYAWGNEWEDGIINSAEAEIDRTTAVGAFPRGAAECGADDMGGNVWEWTDPFYDSDQDDSDQDSYVVRGGSWDYKRGEAWFFSRDNARVAHRSWYYPFDSYFNIGFRLVAPVS
jgi:formylglycine-generating enzyme required for sulfatase activity